MVTVQWLRQDRRETERLDRQAERDNDAELTAYNEGLARLAGRDQERR
jgi:putative copper resistance protein D